MRGVEIVVARFAKTFVTQIAVDVFHPLTSHSSHFALIIGERRVVTRYRRFHLAVAEEMTLRRAWGGSVRPCIRPTRGL
jgi:hypothetical protein